ANSMGNLTIRGSLIGGTQNNGGKIGIGTKMGNLFIGGSMTGGAGGRRAAILATTTGSGTIRGWPDGGAPTRGTIVATTIGNVAIGGSVVGGSGVASGQISGRQKIGNVTVAGDLVSGGGLQSGSLISGGTLGNIKIGGSIIGTSARPAIISAFG